MEASKTVTCKVCGEIKEAFVATQSKAKKERKWIDKTGRYFNGKTCPDCHASNMRVRQKAAYEKRKA